MSLSIGIIGLPNVGKSTLFNALLKRQVALAANYPFATIEPNVGIVSVPDSRLEVLAQIVETDFKTPPQKITPATIKFYDIAGLVEGASRGEGLGNKFLAHIREVDALVHVVRAFDDPNVIKEGSVDPQHDLQIINTELILADLEVLDKRITKHETTLKKDKTPENVNKADFYTKVRGVLNAGQLLTNQDFSREELGYLQELNLLTSKPMLLVFNTEEGHLNSKNTQTTASSEAEIFLSAKIESELSVLSDEDQKLFMQELGIAQSGLDQVIKVGYGLLNLQTYLTAGPKEVRAWTITKGDKAPQAAGKIHTDFERGFIKAEVINFSELSRPEISSFKVAKEKGLLRIEGKEYVMQDGDVVEFRVGV